MLRQRLLFLLLVLSSLRSFAQNERHFTFHYAFTVKNVSHGERMRVWIPLAHSDSFQEVKVTSKGGDLPLKQVQQSEYGNEVLFAELRRPIRTSTSSRWTMTLCEKSMSCWSTAILRA